MSHFNEVKTKIKNPELLVQALSNIGLTAIVHKQPVHLHGYVGDTREQLAHIVVKGGKGGNSGLSPASNDLGFYREADGTYRMIISDYDTGFLRNRYARDLPSFDARLKQEYALAAAKQVLPGAEVSNLVQREDGSMTFQLSFETAQAQKVVSAGI